MSTTLVVQMDPSIEQGPGVGLHARLGLELEATGQAGRRGTEEIVAQELDSFMLEPVAPVVPANRGRRSYSTAPQGHPFSGSASRFIKPNHGAIADPVVGSALPAHMQESDFARSSSWTGGKARKPVASAGGVTDLPLTKAHAGDLQRMPSVPEDASRKRSNTLLSGLKRVSSRSILGMGGSPGYSRLAEASAQPSAAPVTPVFGAANASPAVEPMSTPSGLHPMHDMDESREDLKDIVRNSSATNFDDLHRHMKAIQADMDCFDTCVICGEFGKCAPFTCCKTPRHLKCEMEFSKANRLHWRLACATVKEDGTKAFKKLHPPASEAEYAAQLMTAGPELFQLLRCSVCRKPLAAVRAAGDFAPLQWHHIKALREERQVRDEVSMRGSHPYLRAQGCCGRFAALTGYDDVKQFISWQIPWVMGVIVLGAVMMFVQNVFAEDGASDAAGQIAVAVPVSFVIVCMCWSCSHHGAATGTLQQVQEEQEEEAAVNRQTIVAPTRAISTSSTGPLLPSSLGSPPLGAATPAIAATQSVPSPFASMSVQSPLHGALAGPTHAYTPPLSAAAAAATTRSAVRFGSPLALPAAADSIGVSSLVTTRNPSSTENLAALSSRSAALPPV